MSSDHDEPEDYETPMMRRFVAWLLPWRAGARGWVDTQAWRDACGALLAAAEGEDAAVEPVLVSFFFLIFLFIFLFINFTSNQFVL